MLENPVHAYPSLLHHVLVSVSIQFLCHLLLYFPQPIVVNFLAENLMVAFQLFTELVCVSKALKPYHPTLVDHALLELFLQDFYWILLFAVCRRLVISFL